MKPFNLERALAGDPVITCEGKNVIQIAYFPKAVKDHKVVACFEDGAIITYRENGKYNDIQQKIDLMMAPKTKKLWIAIDKKPRPNGYYQCSQAFDDESIKNDFSSDYCIVEVEIEE